MVFLGGFCLIVSMTGLYILLFSSFSPKKTQQMEGDFIIKAARKIRVRKSNTEQEKLAKSQPNPQAVLLIESIIIGEAVGLFFLFLSHNPLKFKFLALNAMFLLVASFLCSVLTLFNTWLKRKTHLIFRIILQATTLIFGVILFRLAIGGGEGVIGSVSIFKVSYYMQLAIYGYFITVVVAIGTMLYIAIKGNPDKIQEFEFSNYLMLVVMSGLLIGSGLLLAYSIKFVSF